MPFYLISTLHAWNSRLMPLFGFPLNALLFWLVWTKTPKEMRVHSRILLQTCCVDLIFLCVCLIASPVLIVYQGSSSILLLDGYFIRLFASIFNYNPMCLDIFNFIFSLCFTFEMFSISLQFVYRYLILNRNIDINLSRYLVMLILPFIGSLIVGIFSTFFKGEAFNIDGMTTSLNDYVDWGNSIHTFGPNNGIVFIVTLVGLVTSYAINIFCAIKLVKFVGAHAGFNPRMKELNQQLTKTLIILSLFPIISIIFVTIMFVVVLVMNFTGIQYLAKILLHLQVFPFSGGNWVTIINPIVSIWINRPYRDAVKKIVASLFKKNSVTPLHIQPFNQ